MIKSNIHANFVDHYNKIQSFSDNIFVVDYTNQTMALPVRRGVEFFSPNQPVGIHFFLINNSNNISVDAIEFNNSSFICGNGNPRSQCEAVFFPSTSTSQSWVLFCELKYSHLPVKNPQNLKKAIKQLYKTRYYYVQKNVIQETNNSYLIASLPMQTEPFANFVIPQPALAKLKAKRNIILRLKNAIHIYNDEIINV